jgi:hypothetical protein
LAAALVVIAFLVVSPLIQAFLTPWLPLERVTLRAIDDHERPPVEGYVLGDGDRELVIMDAASRDVERLPPSAVTQRSLCEPRHRWYALDGRSMVQALSQPDYDCVSPSDIGAGPVPPTSPESTTSEATTPADARSTTTETTTSTVPVPPMGTAVSTTSASTSAPVTLLRSR